jgi:hypothetical protein
MTPIDIQTENRIRAHRRGLNAFASNCWAGGACVATAVFCGIGAATDGGTLGTIAGIFLAGTFTMGAVFFYSGTRRYITEQMETYDIRERRRQCLERTNANFRLRIALLTGRLFSQQSAPGVAGEVGEVLSGATSPTTYEGHGQKINFGKPRLVP